MHPLIDEILRSRVVRDALGEEHTLHSSIDDSEAELIDHLIGADPAVVRTVEVGCAFGLSSLVICSALAERPGAHHVIIDPFQHSQWHGVGVANLARAGFGSFQLIEEPSEFALPKLAELGTGAYDMVLIDGFHTFDHTLVDFFFANRLVRTGGYVVIDDCHMPSVARVASYVMRYPAYRLVARSGIRLGGASVKRRAGNLVRRFLPPRLASVLVPKAAYDKYYSRGMYPGMLAFQKVAEDRLDLDWFESF